MLLQNCQAMGPLTLFLGGGLGWPWSGSGVWNISIGVQWKGTGNVRGPSKTRKTPSAILNGEQWAKFGNTKGKLCIFSRKPCLLNRCWNQ